MPAPAPAALTPLAPLAPVPVDSKAADSKAADSKAARGLTGAITREPGPVDPIGPTYFSVSTYPLYDSFILNTSVNTHVYNNRDRFETFRPLSIPEYLYTGDLVVAI